jgi:hypothetical protein
MPITVSFNEVGGFPLLARIWAPLNISAWPNAP